MVRSLAALEPFNLGNVVVLERGLPGLLAVAGVHHAEPGRRAAEGGAHAAHGQQRRRADLVDLDGVSRSKNRGSPCHKNSKIECGSVLK